MVKPSSTAIIQFLDVCYVAGDSLLLKSLTLEANERRIGVVGRNGSGKSTLARLLCGLIKPSSGTVTINGVDVANDRQQAIHTVGMLFQNPDHQVIFPTVEEELIFGLQQMGQKKAQAIAEVKALLETFGMQDWLQRSISTLSQGQRHFVCLMAILLMKPKLIVLDEPYAGLDIPTTLQLNRYLQDVDATLIHISHHLETLSDYERIWWIDNGQLKLDGTPSEVFPVFRQHMQTLGQTNVIL
ncbi:MAG: cobalt ABC transporter [Proteobacteria bacterium]|nr:MAG: cobalt ABC transporter [Pseudomonadota bacterium]